jgi:hypothetical protein
MKRLAAALLVPVAVAATILAPAGRAEAGEPVEASHPLDRVLIFSLPMVSWADVQDADLPNLGRFFDRAGLADLSTRATPVGLEGRSSLIGDGYVTIGAGTRSVGDGGRTDGEGFGVDERFPPDLAGEVFRRRTGTTPRGDLVQLAIADIEDANAGLPLDAEPGALGDALRDAGFSRAVIANGDGVEPEGDPPVYRRSAVSALMNSTGVVQRGRVGTDLLEPDRRAPFGLQLDDDEVESAFTDLWQPKSVVLVEASDLVRADAYRTFATSDQRDALRAHALRRSDELFGRLLEHVDLQRDAVLVVGPAHETGTTTLAVAAMRAPWVEPGLLRSATTRRAGFVQLVDIAPTVLHLVGVDRPTSMSGRPFEVEGGGGDTAADRIDFLVENDEAAQFIGDQTEPVAMAFTVALTLLAVAMGVWLWGWRPPFLSSGGLHSAALVLLGAIPAVFLARLLPFQDLGAAAYWLFLVGMAFLLGAVYRLVGRRDPLDPLIAATAVVVGLLVADVVLGSRLQINSALGNSPIIGGRFTGFGNLAFAVYSSAALVLAVLLAIRTGGRRGAWLAAIVLGVTILAGGAPFWGADVGGVLAMGPAFLVTVWLLMGWRVRLRTAVLAVAGTLIATAGFALLDLSRSSDDRTHLGRLFETIGDEGWSGFSTVIERKASANLASITGSVWAFALLVAALFVVFVVRFAPAQLRRLDARFPQLEMGVAGAIVLLVLGFALNDSGIRVPALMLLVYIATFVVLVTATSGDGAPAPDEEARADRPVAATAARPTLDS